MTPARIADWRPLPDREHPLARTTNLSRPFHIISILVVVILAVTAFGLAGDSIWIVAVAGLEGVVNLGFAAWLTWHERKQYRRIAKEHPERQVVSLSIVQDDLVTGEDFGTIWLQGGLLHFEGNESSFALAQGMVVRVDGEAAKRVVVLFLSGQTREVWVSIQDRSRDEGGWHQFRKKVERWHETTFGNEGVYPPLAPHPRLLAEVDPKRPRATEYRILALGGAAYLTVGCMVAIAKPSTALPIFGIPLLFIPLFFFLSRQKDSRAERLYDLNTLTRTQAGGPV